MLLWREMYHLLTLEIHFLTQSKWFNLRCFLRSFWCITLFKQLRQLFRRGVPKYLFCIWMWVQSKLSKFHPKHHFYCLLMCTFCPNESFCSRDKIQNDTTPCSKYSMLCDKNSEYNILRRNKIRRNPKFLLEPRFWRWLIQSCGQKGWLEMCFMDHWMVLVIIWL